MCISRSVWFRDRKECNDEKKTKWEKRKSKIRTMPKTCPAFSVNAFIPIAMNYSHSVFLYISALLRLHASVLRSHKTVPLHNMCFLYVFSSKRNESKYYRKSKLSACKPAHSLYCIHMLVGCNTCKECGGKANAHLKLCHH